MISQQLAKFKIETKIKTSLRARGPPGVSGALCSLRILRIGRIGSGVTWSFRNHQYADLLPKKHFIIIIIIIIINI